METEAGTFDAAAAERGDAIWFPLFSYNNLKSSEGNTCGQAAIATLADFYGRDDLASSLKRTLRPEQVQKDPKINQWMKTGKLHYENEAFVGRVHKLFPPDFLPPINMSVRETLMKAFDRIGIRYRENWPSGAGDGASAKRALVDYFRKTYAAGRHTPVLVLLDMLKIWPGGAFKLHWGIVHGISSSHVLVASWHRSEWIPWETFLEGWHCWFLPHPPNQFYQLQTAV